MPYIFYILIGLALLAFIYLLYYLSEAVSIKRRFKKTPFQKIAYVKEGEVAKIIGKVLLIDPPIIAPLSGRACAYYHLKIEEQVSTGKSTHWKTLIDEDKICKFLIDDASGGFAYFDSINLKKLIEKDFTKNSSSWKQPDENLLQFLANYNINPNNWLGFKKTIRYQEGILEPNEKVALVARGEWKKTEELELPSSYYRVLYLLPTEAQEIYISDFPNITDTHQQDILT